MTSPIRAVGVVVPARNEQLLIRGCLDALRVAANRADVPVEVLVALDDCDDATGDIASAAGVSTLAGHWRSVGAARAAGFASLRLPAPPAEVWLASTDADSRVDPDWIAAQLRLARRGADAVFGVVDVDLDGPVRERYDSHYANSTKVHGASFGLRLDAYLRVGGIAPLDLGEDQDLADRLDADPLTTVVRDPDVRVTTSSRRSSRVSGGFASLINSFG